MREDLPAIIYGALRGHQVYMETGDKRYGIEVGIKSWLYLSAIVVSVVWAFLFTPLALIIWTDPEPLFWWIRLAALGGIVGAFFSIRGFLRFNRKVNGRVGESQVVPPPIPGPAQVPGQSRRITSGRY